mgnify:CR=1 FL=1
MDEIDVMVYDIQDNGCRSYTYISTLGKLMEACIEYNKQLVVLDRPNPLGGEKIEGNVEFSPVHNGSIFDKVYNDNSKINSYHHQCINKLAPNFTICGYSNGCIEAIVHNELPIIAVQWHPE